MKILVIALMLVMAIPISSSSSSSYDSTTISNTESVGQYLQSELKVARKAARIIERRYIDKKFNDSIILHYNLSDFKIDFKVEFE